MKRLVLFTSCAFALSAPAWAQPSANPASPPAAAPTPAPAETPAGSQPPAKADAAATAAPKLEDLAWLGGCWKGTVNRREYREEWLPLRGNMMIGVSQTVLDDRTDDYEYLRLEPRADGVYYVAVPGGRNEAAFRLVQATTDSSDGSRTFVFTDAARDFPQRIAYRRGTAGWLYAEVAGKVDGKDRSVVYPMRRIDCATGTFIEQ